MAASTSDLNWSDSRVEQSLSIMEIRDLMYLEASATVANFTRAAKTLGINPSTISRRIGRLEDEVGLAVFERQHAGVRLTSGGKAILPHIRRALAEFDAIRHAGDQNGNGIVGEVGLAVRMPPVGEPLGASCPGGEKDIQRSCFRSRK